MDETGADPQLIDPLAVDPERLLDRELEAGVPDGFTLGVVGDCVISRPVSQTARIADVLPLLRGCDALVGNLETVIVDVLNGGPAPHPWGGDWPLAGDPRVAADLVALGFTLLARANNHALDWGVDGLRECGARLEAAGLAHAGCGEAEGTARAPRYAETAKGRAGLVSFTTTFRETTDALPPCGAAPGRPGVSALRLTAATVVAPEVMPVLERAARALRESHVGGPAPDADGALWMLGRRFEAGSPAGYRYALDGDDLAATLRAVRQGKQSADVLVAAVHSHEPESDEAPERPAAFLRELAARAIDAGADAVVTTGIHHLGPIEFYRGRPVFHGLGNFIWSDLQEPLPHDLRRQNAARLARAFAHPERATDADLTAVLNHPTFTGDESFRSVLVQIRFAQGRPAEVLLHPVDLGRGEPLTRSGIPALAAPRVAQEILHNLQEMSGPYGTAIEIEPGPVGVIRPS